MRLKKVTHDLNIYGPLEQAKRCLDQWLREEDKCMPKRLKDRTAALLARYFYFEEDLTDALILSFLRHYSGMGEVDMDDASAVRLEIASVLEKAVPTDTVPVQKTIKEKMIWGGLSAIITLLVCGIWFASQMTITEQQQKILRDRVAEISKNNPSKTTAGIWADIKQDLNIRKYQEMSYWDFDDVMNGALKE